MRPSYLSKLFVISSTAQDSFHRKNTCALTSTNRFLEILNRQFLACKVVALLMVKPTQLLKHFSVVGVGFEDPHVGIFRGIVLMTSVRPIG